MTSSYDWPCSLQIYSIQMPHAAAAYGQIYGFSADNLANKISAAYYVYPHLQYASTHLRIYVCIYISAAIIRGTPTHLTLPFPMPSTQQYSRAQQNRRDEQRRLRRARRNETLNCRRIHVMEGVAGDKLKSNMSDTTTPVLHQHTCVVLTCPPPSLSSGNYLCFVQSATKNREHLRWMHGTTFSLMMSSL